MRESNRLLTLAGVISPTYTVAAILIIVVLAVVAACGTTFGCGSNAGDRFDND